MPFFFIEVVVSVVYALVNLVIGWSGVALLFCGIVGATLRLRADRDSAIYFDSIMIGFDIARDLRVGVDDPD